MTNPDFTPDNVERVSKAAKSLCMWVRAMDTYARIAKNVEPKRQALQAAEKQVAEMNALLAEKTSELRKVQDRVAALEEKLNTTLRQKEALQKQSDETTARPGRAEELMGGLSGEKIRWDAELVQLDRDRYYHEAQSSMASFDRPSNSGQSLDSQYGASKPHAGHQAH